MDVVSYIFSCGGLSPVNLAQEMRKILNLNEKVSQISGEIVNIKDFDGTLSSFPASAPSTYFEKLRPCLSGIS